MPTQSSRVKYALAEPIVVKRKKKKRASKAYGEFAFTERHLTKAARHTIGAASAGLGRYANAQRKSRKKNGKRYVLDIVPNAVDGSAVAMRKLTVVPVDLMRAAYSPSARKVTRKTVEVGASIASRLLIR